MKIDEPKTPYTRHYDPAEDEDEIRHLDAQELMVDELDNKRELGISPSPSASGNRQSRPTVSDAKRPSSTSRRTRESDIPGLDIGEPEEPYPEPSADEQQRILASGESRSREKSVVVTPDIDAVLGGHGEDELAGMPPEEREKHRKFEAKRRQHYEMRDVKGLLGHPELTDAMDEDEKDSSPEARAASAAPPLPIREGGGVNGA